MSVSTNIRIEIVFLMDKVESPTIVQRKLEAEFRKNPLQKNCTIATFQYFGETGTVENRWCSGKP